MGDWIRDELAAIETRGELRQLVVWPEVGPYLRHDGRTWLNLASNDYLGLTQHPAVREAAAEAARRFGPGATASRLLVGTTSLHAALEEALASWKGHPTALLFSSGYLAALGILPLLAGREDLIVADRLAHACLLDAARLSGATLRRFRHNDPQSAADFLRRERGAYRRAVLVTESVFSMDGDRAPLADLLDLALRHDAWLLVDEAHALGAAGPRGAGYTADAPESQVRLVTLGTLGKSLAAAGGFITGSRELHHLMINRARTFIFDTALPPPTIAAAHAALEEIQAHPDWPASLLDKSARFRARLQRLGLNTLNSDSQIIPVLIGDNAETLRIASELWRRNILVAAVRPPTVPPGTARLRLSVSLLHEDGDLAAAADAIAEITGAPR